MMWIVRRILVLKDATMNSNPYIVTDSHESSTIFLSYNNIVPWLPYVTILCILSDLNIDVNIHFDFWLYFHSSIEYERFANYDPFQYFENEVIEILCSMIKLLCVYLKGCKCSSHNCHWVVGFKHCISFETHLSTLKFVSTKAARK
jgi:hypothetical protein